MVNWMALSFSELDNHRQRRNHHRDNQTPYHPIKIPKEQTLQTYYTKYPYKGGDIGVIASAGDILNKKLYNILYIYNNIYII